MIPDYVVVGLALWGIAELAGQIRRWEDSDVKPWVRRFRTHPLRWPVKGSLAMFAGYVALEWWHTVALPHLRDGPTGWLMLGIIILIGSGLGVSLAKHTMTDFSVLRTD